MTLNRVAIPSPNYSSRGGTGVRLVVLHTAQGALSFTSLGSFFANPSSGVSSHAGIDDTPGTIGVYVKRGDKAWTQANANPYSVSAELCAFAEWDVAEWHRHPQMLVNCAAWIAEESAAFGIPIRALSAAEAPRSTCWQTPAAPPCASAADRARLPDGRGGRHGRHRHPDSTTERLERGGQHDLFG